MAPATNKATMPAILPARSKSPRAIATPSIVLLPLMNETNRSRSSVRPWTSVAPSKRNGQGPRHCELHGGCRLREQRQDGGQARP